MKTDLLKTLIIGSTFIWCGLIIGISFMEAPLKFQAPNITLALGLGIGQIVFGVLNKMEILLALIIVLSFVCINDDKIAKHQWRLYIIPIIILTVQSLYLLPQLSARINLILSGITPPPSQMHWYYVLIEFIKLFNLLAAGFIFTKKQMTIQRG